MKWTASPAATRRDACSGELTSHRFLCGWKRRNARRLPTVGAPQYVRGRERLDVLWVSGFIHRTRACERSTGTRVPRFAVARRAFALRPIPVVPPFRPNDVRHLGRDECRLRVIAPRAAQIRLRTGRAGHATVRDDEPVALVHRGRGRGDVAIAQDVNVAALKERRCAAEDEIDVTGDVASQRSTGGRGSRRSCPASQETANCGRRRDRRPRAARAPGQPDRRCSRTSGSPPKNRRRRSVTVGVLNVPIGLPSGPIMLAWRS